MKKISHVFIKGTIVFTVIISMVIPIHAKNTLFEQVIKEPFIKIGYTKVYMDDKPEIPNSVINIDCIGQNIRGKGYTTVLLDQSQKEVAKTTGTLTDNQSQIDFEIPSTLKNGRYSVKTIINEEEDIDEVVLLSNENLDSEVSTNVVGYSGSVGDLIDGIQWAMFTPCNNKPTIDNPAIFTFDYGKLIDVHSLDLYSTFGNDQGPKTAEILYWDNHSKMWVNILNHNQKEYHFKWEKNVECEPVTINFDKLYTTNKIMLKVTDSYTSWENTNDIVEVQAWGYDSGKLPSISMDSKQGIYGQENTVSLEIMDSSILEETKVMMELVDSKSHNSLTNPVKYTDMMSGGQLVYDFVVPDWVAIGSYCIKVTYKNYEDYSDVYRIVQNQNTNLEECSKCFNISSLDEKNNATKITVINDHKFDTSWSNKGNTKLLFEVNPENNKFTNVVLKSMKIHANKDSIDNMTLKYIANTNYYRNVNISENGMVTSMVENIVPNWQRDTNGDYFIIDSGFLAFGNIYVLEMNTKETINIQEIEIEGIYLKENLFAKAKITHNGNVIDASDMTDNVVSSYYKTTSKEDEEYVFDFSPRTITANEVIYSAHFPKSQGISKMKVEIWKNGLWKEVGVYELNYQTDNQIRESQQLIFDEVTTEKVRLTVLEAPRVWDDGAYLFSDINIIGKVHTNAQYIADTLDADFTLNQGDKKLKLPTVEGYDISISSTSDESVIDLNGNIYSPEIDTNVIVKLKVKSQSDSKDVGITDKINILVPKKIQKENKLISMDYDSTTIYNNPAMGWVQYYEFSNSLVDAYWKEMDKLYAKGLHTNILYIRNPWSWYEPEEGKYAWENPHSQLSQLIKGARERGLQLAFRVILDSTDCFQQATPEYVFDAGASWYNTERTDSTAPDLKMKDPYINDPIFVEKLDKFIKSFAKEFNDDVDIAYIDGMGFGNWGEGHTVRYNSKYDNNINDAVKKVVDIYNKYFPDVLLGTMEGQPERYGTGTNSQDISEFIDSNEPYTDTFKKEYDFVIRKDTFGWMNDEIRNNLLSYFEKGVPIFAENCYHSFQDREYWYNNAGFPTLDSILQQVVDDALYVRANTLDARTVMDCQSWFENDQENHTNDRGLLEQFALSAGYRIAPTTFEIPKNINTGEAIRIHHMWRNYGLGVLPNNNAHWDNKYKVAFALLDNQTDEVVYQYNESTQNVNPGDWLKENGNNDYESSLILPNTIQSGEYKLAVALVDEKNHYLPAIDLAIKNSKKSKDGWYIVDTVKVKNNNVKDMFNIIIDPSENGIVKADKFTAMKGEDVILTFIPNKGYVLDKVYINNREVSVANNEYVIRNIQNDVQVKASFKEKNNMETNLDESKKDENEKSSLVQTGDSQHVLLLIVVLLASLYIIIYKRKKE